MPTLDDPRLGSRWFGSFDGTLPPQLPGDSDFLGSPNERAHDLTSLDVALPLELPGDSTLACSANERAQCSTLLDGTFSTLSPGHVPISDRLSLKSHFAEPSVAADRPHEPYNALDVNLVACEQEEKREQYFKEDDLGGVGSSYKTDIEIWPSEQLARVGTNQETHLAVYQHQLIGGTHEQPPDLSSMRTTVQPSIIPGKPLPVLHAQVIGSSNLSKANTTTDNTRPWVLEDTAPEPRYETAPSSPLIRPTRSLQFYIHAPFSFESLRGAMTPLDGPISRAGSDACGYESVRGLHTSSRLRRKRGFHMQRRLGTLSGVAISRSSQSVGRIEPPDLVVAKHPDQYNDQGFEIVPSTHDHIDPRQEDNGKPSPPTIDMQGKPSPPTIDMQSAPPSNVKRSGLESHEFILSALTWLVEPSCYAVNDTVISDSISETTIILFGNMSGKTSACVTYGAQNPELMPYAAITGGVTDYRIRVPMIINEFGVTQESIVRLRDTPAELWAKNISYLSRYVDAVLLCFQVSEGLDYLREDVGTCPPTFLPFTETSKWLSQIRKECPQVPVMLVGMRTDERKGTYRDGSFHAASYEDGLVCAQVNKTAAYVECSSTNVQSINQMFEAAIRLALVSKLKVQQVRSPRLKHKLSRWWQGHREKLSI